VSGWAELDPAAPHREGCPLAEECQFCPEPATHWEALMLSPSGEGPPIYRCDEHARRTLAPGMVSGNLVCICLDLASEEEPDPDREHDAGR
jgi:hypothetical protein